MTPHYTHEWLCQKIVEDTHMAVVFADRDGIIRLWNSGAEAMFGYQADEALGQTLDLIVPERQRPRHWEGYRNVMATGMTKYGQQSLAVPANTKDGRRISIEFNVALVHAPTGELLGVAAILQDVTARWQQQKELKERLAALEGKVVAKSA